MATFSDEIGRFVTLIQMYFSCREFTVVYFLGPFPDKLPPHLI